MIPRTGALVAFIQPPDDERIYTVLSVEEGDESSPAVLLATPEGGLVWAFVDSLRVVHPVDVLPPPDGVGRRGRPAG